MTGGYLCEPMGVPYTSETFDLDVYLADLDQTYGGKMHLLLQKSYGRIELTREDPLLFALTYMPETFKPEVGYISFGDAHLDFCRDAHAYWMSHKKGECRDAYIEPRNMGKSTWLFKLLPMWAAAHGHRRFIAAFSDSEQQSMEHLRTFRDELENNQLLKLDFPLLCQAKRRERGSTDADNATSYKAQSGFVFKTKGIGTSVLGMKVGDLRPDLIILDDIEKGESKSGERAVTNRLLDLQDTILPLNRNAVVVLAGTVHKVGSIVDDLARSAESAEPIAWVKSTQFRPHYGHALVRRDDGTYRSIWKDMWSLETLLRLREVDARGFAKNFENAPLATDGIYWEPEMFQTGTLESASFTILSVDPAVSTKSKSDWTGMCILSYSQATDMFEVEYSDQVKMNSRQLRARVLSLLEQYPHIGAILVETNQGGESMWVDEDGVFFDLPVRVLTVHQKGSKELRAERVIPEFTQHKVLFREDFPELKRMLLAFPNVAHDDMVDALTSGIHDIRNRTKADRRVNQPVARKTSYTR